MRVEVKPELLRWALERNGFEPGDVAGRLPRVPEWISGKTKPTLKQLEAFATATHTPIGYLFGSEPPVERVPIPDFRTIAGTGVARPSPDLLDTVYLCQVRQDWYHDFARTEGEPPLSFVGSAQVGDDVVRTADAMRDALGFDLDERREAPTWTDALRLFIGQTDEAGILVMVSGVVGSNTRRVLKPEEFRGFALADDLAPLVFINGADSKAAQMFTLAHELAHIWIGQSALSDAQALIAPAHHVERWCNQVAAELLVPLDLIRGDFDARADLSSETARLARRFKVSALVVLRRIFDAGGLSREEYWAAYESKVEELKAIAKGSGGNFYLTHAVRLSRRFARALIGSTLEGHTLYRDAFRMLGVSKDATFRKLSENLGYRV
jgi:Zn-dependent peptidase ImmA (M78 family)